MSTRLGNVRVLLLVVVAMALAAAGGAYAATALVAGGSPPVREALAAANNPTGGKGRTLGLSKVTIPVGASLALHHHAGTQIARIDQGVLTYTVEKGGVDVYRGSADEPKRVRRIAAGRTGRIKAGEWIIEQPSTVHQAANKGKQTIVIHLASLVPIGAPPSIPDAK